MRNMQKTDIATNDYDINVYFGGEKYRDTPRKEAYGHVKYLYTDLTDIRKYYIRLGFHLDEFERCGYHFDFGYATLADFCMANLGLDKSAVSRCICVFHEFNAANVPDVNKGCAMELAEKWNEYSYTQLCEMLPLSPKEREEVTPDMTIKQIREYKKKLKDDKKLTQPDNSPKPVASTQPKRFDFIEFAGKSGIVAQNYIKSCTQKKCTIKLQLFDNRGRKILCGTCGILDQSSMRLVIRMYDSFDPAAYIPISVNQQPDQKGDHNE